MFWGLGLRLRQPAYRDMVLGIDDGPSCIMKSFPQPREYPERKEPPDEGYQEV